jgi:uncharacterized membrane protein YgcG
MKLKTIFIILAIGLSTSFAAPINVDNGYITECSTTITKEQVAELNGKLETLAKDRSIQCLIIAISTRDKMFAEHPKKLTEEELNILIVSVTLHDSTIESREESFTADLKLEKAFLNKIPQSFKAKNHYEGLKLIVNSIIRMLGHQGEFVSDIDPDLEKSGVEIQMVQRAEENPE